MPIKRVQKGAAIQGGYDDAIFPGTSQKVTTGASSTQSAALGASTTLVRIFTTKAAHFAFGANPTAVADGTCLYLPDGGSIFVAVVGGSKIAAIQDTATGSVFITEAASA